MEANRISTFMLERYRLGELSGEEMRKVSGALEADSGLRSRMESLDKSDRELRLRYPLEYFDFESAKRAGTRSRRWTAYMQPRYLARIAAVLLVFVMLPVIYLTRSGQSESTNSFSDSSNRFGDSMDRAKGASAASAGLSVYLKGDEDPVSNQETLSEGSTVQLAYTAPAGEHYGVIFSVDGRSGVTMHYPYRMGQSSLLVSGKPTLLSEAYTLDDAPSYEIFVFVLSSEILKPEDVMRSAEAVAAKAGASGPKAIEEQSRAAFSTCDVETVTVLKK